MKHEHGRPDDKNRQDSARQKLQLSAILDRDDNNRYWRMVAFRILAGYFACAVTAIVWVAFWWLGK